MKFGYTMGKPESDNHSSPSASEFVNSPCRIASTYDPNFHTNLSIQ